MGRARRWRCRQGRRSAARLCARRSRAGFVWRYRERERSACEDVPRLAMSCAAGSELSLRSQVPCGVCPETATGAAMSKANLSEKVIVVTGASSGFGRGAALALAKRGASLVLAARRAPLLEELADQCREQGGRAIAVPTDVGLSNEVERL